MSEPDSADKPDVTTSWRDKRREDAAAQAEAHAQRRAVETEQARELVRDFARQAREAGLTPLPLRAYSYDARATYRTSLTGWRLQRSGYLAVTTDGEFYNLSVPPSHLARLRGAHVEPADPPLIVGAGGPDGTSMPISELLALRLDAGDAWRA